MVRDQQILNQEEWHRGNPGCRERISRFKLGNTHFILHKNQSQVHQGLKYERYNF